MSSKSKGEKILLCTIGMTPQVVTETIEALASWRPDRVEIVTTGGGVGRLRKEWPLLLRIWGVLFPADPPTLLIFAPSLDGVAPVRIRWDGGGADPNWSDAKMRGDIVTTSDVEAMGDLIKDRVWEAVRASHSELHVSIAGGRKTMSAQAMLALCLVGRPQDEASHVLVEQPFEDHQQFWCVGQGFLINTRSEYFAHQNTGAPLPPPTLDPSNAKVTLIRTPIPLVSEIKVSREALGKMRFAELTQQFEMARQFRLKPSLVLDQDTYSVTIQGVTKRLGKKPFFQLRILARAMKQRWPGAGPDGADGKGWLTLASMIGPDSGPPGLFEKELADIRRIQTLSETMYLGFDAKLNKLGQLRSNSIDRISKAEIRGHLVKDLELWFGAMRANYLSAEITEKFGALITPLVLPMSGRKNSDPRMGLGFPPEAITFR